METQGAALHLMSCLQSSTHANICKSFRSKYQCRRYLQTAWPKYDNLREKCSVEMPFNEETGKLQLNFTEINSLSKNLLQAKNQTQ